jgi:hypothetical protein
MIVNVELLTTLLFICSMSPVLFSVTDSLTKDAFFTTLEPVLTVLYIILTRLNIELFKISSSFLTPTAVQWRSSRPSRQSSDQVCDGQVKGMHTPTLLQ